MLTTADRRGPFPSDPTRQRPWPLMTWQARRSGAMGADGHHAGGAAASDPQAAAQVQLGRERPARAHGRSRAAHAGALRACTLAQTKLNAPPPCPALLTTPCCRMWQVRSLTVKMGFTGEASLPRAAFEQIDADKSGVVGLAEIRISPRPRSIMDAPSKDGPSKDGPSKDGPSKDGPSKDGPSKDGPSKDGPSKDGPSKDGVSSAL
jgi:hypothetical protein